MRGFVNSAERLATVREDERRAVAVTLHERVAQELYAAQLNLKALERKSRGSSGIMDLAKGLSRAIDQSIEDVRNLTDQLYPTSPTPSAIGGSRALAGKSERCREYGRRRAAARVSRTEDGKPDAVLPCGAGGACERGPHAAASNVTISLEADSERISMVVATTAKGSRLAIFASRVHLACWESENGLRPLEGG